MRSRPFRLAALSGTLTAGLIFGAFYQPVVVLGHSMEPTLKDRQLVWMDRQSMQSRAVHRGDVVVFRHEGTTYVKRVYALPNDVVTLAEFPNGDTWLVSDMSNAKEGRRLLHRLPDTHFVHLPIPAGRIYVVGDNRSVSMDSRDFGTIPLKEVAGIVPAPADMEHATAPQRLASNAVDSR